MIETNPQGVSVIVCCYNSSKLLPQTLKHLAGQRFSKYTVAWEIILVDNASKDNTSKVAKNEWVKYNTNVPLHLLCQPTPGLSHARDMGINHAQYEYLIFCDDDNWLCAGYVEQAYENMINHEEVSVFGGCGSEVCEVPPPEWFADLKAAYAVGGQAPAGFGEIDRARGFVYAAGAVFRKSHLLMLAEEGFLKRTTGRKGKSLSSGEDVELCHVLLLNGKKIYYDERLQFGHFLTKSRLNWSYFKRMSKGFGDAFPLLMPYRILLTKQFSRFKLGIGWLYISAFYLIGRTAFFELPRSLFSKKYYRVRSGLSSHMGFLCSLFHHHSTVRDIYKTLPNTSWIREEFKTK